MNQTKISLREKGMLRYSDLDLDLKTSEFEGMSKNGKESDCWVKNNKLLCLDQVVKANRTL